MTFSNYDAQVAPFYKRLNIQKAQNIYKLELAKFMHKFHDGLLPRIYNGLFQISSNLHNYSTRYASNQNYFIPSVHNNIGHGHNLVGNAGDVSPPLFQTGDIICHVPPTFFSLGFAIGEVSKIKSCLSRFV